MSTIRQICRSFRGCTHKLPGWFDDLRYRTNRAHASRTATGPCGGRVSRRLDRLRLHVIRSAILSPIQGSRAR